MNRQCLVMQGVAAMVTLFCATLCFAQATDKPVDPYVGEVVAAGGADMHAGGGRNFYTLGRVEQGQRVVVRNVLFQWYAIVPPAGAYGYVSKGHVDATGDGRRGIVNRPDATVTAASVDGPGVSYSRQATLKKGDIVTIVSEDGSFYKIEPPENAIVWLPPNSVRKLDNVSVDSVLKPAATKAPTKTVELTSTPPVDTTDESTVTDAGTVDSVTGSTTTTATPPPTDITATPDTTMTSATDAGSTPADDDGVATTADSNTALSTTDATTSSNDPPSVYDISVKAESPALQALETQLLAAGRQPLEDQPLDTLIAAYTEVLQQGGLTVLDQRIVGARIEQMTRQAEIAKLLKSLKQTQEAMASPEAARMPEPKPRERTAYNAVGQLLASGVYDGQSAPLLFRVVEPANLRTIAYIRPGRNFDSQGNLGRIVGVVGDTAYDPTLKLRVLEVEAIDVLEE